MARAFNPFVNDYKRAALLHRSFLMRIVILSSKIKIYVDDLIQHEVV